jgi:hypothetical protein
MLKLDFGAKFMRENGRPQAFGHCRDIPNPQRRSCSVYFTADGYY